MTLTKDTDRECIFCHHEGRVYEVIENNLHNDHLGYQCYECWCIWNDETEKAVTA